MIFTQFSNKLAIAAGAALTSQNLKLYDLSNPQNQGDMLVLETVVYTGATPPGANKNLTVKAAYASDSDATAAELATAAFVAGAIVLPNLANVRRFYMSQIQYQGARYLYTWLDWDNLDFAINVTTRINTKR